MWVIPLKYTTLVQYKLTCRSTAPFLVENETQKKTTSAFM